MILVGNSFAQFAICHQHLLLFLVDEVLVGLFMTIRLLLGFRLIFPFLTMRFLCSIFSLLKVILEVVVVSQLNSVVSRDVKVLVTDII